MSDEERAEVTTIYNNDAEQSLLGRWLCDDLKSSCYHQTKIKPDDFYFDEHVAIAEAVEALVSSGSRADPVTVGAELTKRGLLDKAGGIVYLKTLVGLRYTSENASYYADIIKDTAQSRVYARWTKDAYYQALNPATPLSSVRESLSQLLVEGRESRSRTQSQVILEDILPQLLDEDLEKREREGYPRARIESLDRIMDGFRPGRLGILAAPPSVGKTSLASWIVEKNATHEPGISCAYISLEMSAADIVRRLLSAESGVENGKSEYTQDERVSLARAASVIRDAPVYYRDPSDVRQTEDDVLDAVQQAAVVDRCKLIVVDYVQLVLSSGKGYVNRPEELSRFASKLRWTAGRYGVYVLALSQVNRESIKGGGKLKMQDLKDSSGLEQAADDVILLMEGAGSTDERGIMECVVDKHRSGAKGSCQLDFDKKCQRWSSHGGAPAVEG